MAVTQTLTDLFLEELLETGWETHDIYAGSYKKTNEDSVKYLFTEGLNSEGGTYLITLDFSGDAERVFEDALVKAKKAEERSDRYKKPLVEFGGVAGGVATGLGYNLFTGDNPIFPGMIGAGISQVLSVLGARGLDKTHDKLVDKIKEYDIEMVVSDRSRNQTIIQDAIHGNNLYGKQYVPTSPVLSTQ